MIILGKRPDEATEKELEPQLELHTSARDEPAAA